MICFAKTGQLCLVLFAILICAVPVQAAEAEAITVGNERQRINPTQLALLEDTTATLSYPQAASAWEAGHFKTLQSDSINKGITRSAYWSRLQIINPGPAPRRVILSHDYAPTDDIRLYTGEAPGNMRVAGDTAVVPAGTLRSRIAGFELQLQPFATQVVYLRVATDSNLNLDFSLWPPAHFQRHEQLIGLSYGVLFGSVAVTVLYLLFAAQLSREPNALLLAAYLASYGLYLAFLNGFPSLWLPNALLVSINALHLATIGLLFGFGAMFYRRYMQLAKEHIWADRFVALLQWLAFAVVLSPLLPRGVLSLILVLIAGIGPLFTIGFAFYLWYGRRPYASVFALGWSVAHIAAMLGTLRVLGYLPNTDLLLHLPAIGCAVAFAFFTWSIAHRLAAERAYAYTDFLTGLANRRLFSMQGEVEFERARRYGHPLSLVLLDVDHFKRVNDTWGHAFGDRVLCRLAEHCQKESRSSDLVVRLGGEEFAILLVETAIAEAHNIAERLRLAQMSDALEGREVTVSIGISELLPDDRGIEDVVQRADETMYRAKKAGRNRTELQVETPSLQSLKV